MQRDMAEKLLDSCIRAWILCETEDADVGMQREIADNLRSVVLDAMSPRIQHDISGLDFSVRTYNILKRSGIDTVEQLAEMTEDELMSLRFMQRKNIDEIHAKLEGVE